MPVSPEAMPPVIEKGVLEGLGEGEPTVQEDPDWKSWDAGERPHHGRGWVTLSTEQLQQIVDVDVLDPEVLNKKGANRINQAIYDEFVRQRRRQGLPPPKFQ